MAVLTIELPSHRVQTEFNLRRWRELLADPELAKWEGRVETNRHGHIIVSHPPPPSHGSFQSWIGHLLSSLMVRGRVYMACPISTADGVKAADVAWASFQRVRELGHRTCFPQAPEICVEVISPSNTRGEIEEKTTLYFDAGAQEVWICELSGVMRFKANGGANLRNLALCPAFPKKIEFSDD